MFLLSMVKNIAYQSDWLTNKSTFYVGSLVIVNQVGYDPFKAEWQGFRSNIDIYIHEGNWSPVFDKSFISTFLFDQCNYSLF